jgi:glutamate transport system substrate-binding protein
MVGMTEPNGRGRVTPLSRLPWRRITPRQSTVEDIAARDIAAEEIAAAVAVAPVTSPDEAAPVIEEPPPSKWSLAPLRLAALGLALVLVIGIGMAKLLVGGPPSVDQLRAAAGVDTWTVLSIGVKADQPGVGYYDPKTKIWSGFDVDIAYMIAEDLGFRHDEVRFYGIESEDRARMQATQVLDGKPQRVPVKMVIASYSITPERKLMAGVTFSNSYLYTEQSVITRVGHVPVATLDDFGGQTVCTLSASTSEKAPELAKAIVIRKNLISDCVSLLRAGKVDAVTTDAAILAGIEAEYPTELKHWDLGLDRTEAWGVNVGDNQALKTLVDFTLYRSWKDPHDGRWERAYKTNLQSEAGAQNGTPIAVGEQPVAARPDVRQLPWEDVLHE